jgi:hypothetical protein
VQEVIRNLMISRIEFRGEDDPDVRSYSFSRQLDVRVVSSSGNRWAQKTLPLFLFCDPPSGCRLFTLQL